MIHALFSSVLLESYIAIIAWLLPPAAFAFAVSPTARQLDRPTVASWDLAATCLGLSESRVGAPRQHHNEEEQGRGHTENDGEVGGTESTPHRHRSWLLLHIVECVVMYHAHNAFRLAEADGQIACYKRHLVHSA